MVKRRDSKSIGSKVESAPNSSMANTPSGASTPVSTSAPATVDWNKVTVSFKNPNFQVIIIQAN